MRQAVQDAWLEVNAPLEGRVPWPYLDEKCLVTVAVGNLIDPLPLALRLPWQYESGGYLNEADIAQQWERVKSATALAKQGGGAFENLTDMRLSPANMDKLDYAKLASNDAILKGRFSNWELLPADAQMGVHSLAWACGPDFVFPRFAADLIAGAFATYVTADDIADASTPGDLQDPPEFGALKGGCALECLMEVGANRGLIPRNALNQRLFEAAQRVVDQQLDPSVLYGIAS